MARGTPAFLGKPVSVPRAPPRRLPGAKPTGAEWKRAEVLAGRTAGTAIGDAAAADTPLRVVVGFSVEDQIESNWCWAALTLALIKKYGGHQMRRQCEIVKEAFPHLSPCADSSSANHMLELSGSLKYFGMRNGESVAGQVGPERIVEQIKAQQPVCVRVRSDLRPAGHVIAISGYQIIDGEMYVQVEDPAENGGASNTRGPFPFATLQTRYFGEATEWNRTYFTKPPA
ncbi:MAG TPA: papain-like cysteine protease family protein [Allosphingosinicella sp.]|jgi:hypothetical protein